MPIQVRDSRKSGLNCQKLVVIIFLAILISVFNILDSLMLTNIYNLLRQVGLIDPFKGGVIKVESFYKAAQNTCNYPNTDQPFMCLDLTFIYVLLHDGFGLDRDTQLAVSDPKFFPKLS